MCCSPWGRKESDMTEWLNSTQEYITYLTEETLQMWLNEQLWVGEIILDYLGGLNGSLESKNFSRLESEEDVIMKNGQRDTMLWALKIGEGGCEPWNVNRKTSKS